MLMMMGFIVASFLYYEIRQSQKDTIKRLVKEKSSAVAQLINQRLEERFVALDRMASRHGSNSEEMRASWKKDAQNYYKDFSGFQALEWANQQTKIEWIYPIKGNETAIGEVLNSEGKRDYAIKKAIQNGQGTITKLIQLKQGGAGFLSIHPTFADSELSGYIVGVFRANDIFSNTIDQNYNVQIKFDGELVYEQGKNKLEEYSAWGKTPDTFIHDGYFGEDVRS